MPKIEFVDIPIHPLTKPTTPCKYAPECGFANSYADAYQQQQLGESLEVATLALTAAAVCGIVERLSPEDYIKVESAEGLCPKESPLTCNRRMAAEGYQAPAGVDPEFYDPDTVLCVERPLDDTEMRLMNPLPRGAKETDRKPSGRKHRRVTGAGCI